MQKLIVFNNISLDGYFVDSKGEMTWAHGQKDDEFDAFVGANASGGGTLVFGRKTYEMMAAFWPTQEALEHMPAVAQRMNSGPKIVFSNTLTSPDWNNTRVLAGDIAKIVPLLKEKEGDGLVVLGSGRVVSELARADLVDEYQIIVCPVILGNGRTLFEGVHVPRDLRLSATRSFANGKVFLKYSQKL